MHGAVRDSQKAGCNFLFVRSWVQYHDSLVYNIETSREGYRTLGQGSDAVDLTVYPYCLHGQWLISLRCANISRGAQ